MMYKIIVSSLCLSFMININGQTTTNLPAAATRVKPVRQSAENLTRAPQSAENAQQVASLERAFQNMRANTNAQDPRSLQYWVNTHSHFTDNANSFIESQRGDCENALMATNMSLVQARSTCSKYLNRVKVNHSPDSSNQNVWGKCQHSTLHFLTWHRMYLHYFEKMLRKQSGNPNLAIPYWDYFERARKTQNGELGIALPALVTTQGSALFNEFRTMRLNPYSAPAPTPTNPAATKMLIRPIPWRSALSREAFKAQDFQGLQNILERTPHGAMHCAVGTGCNTPDMGFLQTAGHDPLFYMHHANIDRLWTCWMKQKAGKQPITLAWAKANLGMDQSWFDQTFYFPDADRNNEIVKIRVADLFRPDIIPQYFNESGAKACLQAETVALISALGVKVATEEDSENQYGILTYLSNLFSPKSAYAQTTASNDAVSLAASTVLNGFSNKVKMIAAKTPREKSRKDVKFKKGNTALIISSILLPKSRPPVGYDMYICTDKIQPKPDGFVAQISYFGMLPSEMQGHSTAGHSMQLSYDVTEQLQRLGITNYTDAKVCFEPNDPLFDESKNTLTKLQGKRNIDSTLVLGKIYLEKVK